VWGALFLAANLCAVFAFAIMVTMLYLLLEWALTGHRRHDDGDSP
jgi:hypothetical protein